MIFIREVTEDGKRSIILFCSRDLESQYNKVQSKDIEQNNNDVDNSNENSKDGVTENITQEKTTTTDENTTFNKNVTFDENMALNENSHRDNALFDENTTLNGNATLKPLKNTALGENITSDENVTLNENTTFNENTALNEKTIFYENFFINLDESNETDETHIWDDYECFKISQEDFFPFNVMSLNTQKIVITRFLNFYVSGKLPKGLSVSDVIFAVISIIPLAENNEEFIWFKNEYKENGTLFFLTPEEKLNFEFKNIASKKKKTNENQFNDYQNQKKKSKFPTKTVSSKENIEKFVKDDKVTVAESETISKSDFEANNVDTSTGTKTLPAEQDIKRKSFKISDLVREKSIKWYGNLNNNVSKTLDKLPDFSPVQNSAFNTSCNKLLHTWDINVEARIILKYFFGIIALTLMRGIVKGKNNMLKTFSGEKFCDRIKFINNVINYTRPNESCIIKCCREFKTRERCHQIMFAKVLFNSFRIDCMRSRGLYSPSYGLYNIFRMCIVEHLAYYDLGIINLLKTIYNYIRDDTLLSIIIEELQSDEIDFCLEQVRHFISHYMIETKGPNQTHYWMRFFDDKQFKYLSCADSYATAVMLAVFIENMSKNASIWRSGWVKAREEDLANYKELGNTLYKEYQLKSKTTKTNLDLQFFSCLQTLIQ